MKIILKPLFIFIFFSKILIINLKTLNPLSECNKGRITHYTGWESGGKCSFEAHRNATGATYLYPAAPNLELFNSVSHCGTCYEMVGPNGAIRVRVEDSCPENDELGLCSGDMYHFNVANNGVSYIMGTSDRSNITFRMVECGFSGNIRILTHKDSDIYWLSLVVLDHNLPVSSVTLQEYESDSWVSLNREESNYWTYDPGFEIFFPVKIRIFSINGDYVTVEMKDQAAGEVYEADSNFKKVNNTFFNITTFEKEEIPSSAKNCCEIDLSDFSNIYKNGIINENYYYYSPKVTVNLNSTETFQNKNSIYAKFQSFGKLVIQTNSPIRADQFSGVSIYIKTTQNCSNCMYFRAYDLPTKNQILNFDKANSWKVFRYNFDTLGVENNEFNGIVLYYYKSTSQTFDIYIGTIDLIGKRTRPDTGVCVSIPGIDSGDDITPIPVPVTIPEETETEQTEIPSTNVNNSTNNQTDLTTDNSTDINTTVTDSITENGNATSLLIPVNILSITNSEGTPIITVNCESFQKAGNEPMVLLFISNDNTNTFQTQNCNLPNIETISSFSCILPTTMPNGVYSIQSPSNTGYYIYYPSNVQVSNGQITFYNNYNIDTITEQETETQTESTTNYVTEDISTTITSDSENPSNGTNLGTTDTATEEANSQIVITSSIDQTINSGQILTFTIEPIQRNKYNLNNNEIIFEDSAKTKALYLKSCQSILSRGLVSSISCIVSKNIIRGTYTVLSDGQNISIQSGQSISLTISNSEGGMVTQKISRSYNTSNLLSNIIFQILYYNSTMKPGDLFPYRVYLSGNKAYRSRMRNLDEKYDYNISFPNCTAVSYSEVDSSAIGNLRCAIPNYVPGGTYTKLSSYGFDVSPNSQVNVVFLGDYNYTKLTSTLSKSKSSSSSSKTWIIWLVAGILLLILVIIVIIACISNRKSSGEDANETTNKDNSNGNLENSSQDKNKSDSS